MKNDPKNIKKQRKSTKMKFKTHISSILLIIMNMKRLIEKLVIKLLQNYSTILQKIRKK